MAGTQSRPFYWDATLLAPAEKPRKATMSIVCRRDLRRRRTAPVRPLPFARRRRTPNEQFLARRMVVFYILIIRRRANLRVRSRRSRRPPAAPHRDTGACRQNARRRSRQRAKPPLLRRMIGQASSGAVRSCFASLARWEWAERPSATLACAALRETWRSPAQGSSDGTEARRKSLESLNSGAGTAEREKRSRLR